MLWEIRDRCSRAPAVENVREMKICELCTRMFVRRVREAFDSDGIVRRTGERTCIECSKPADPEADKRLTVAARKMMQEVDSDPHGYAHDRIDVDRRRAPSKAHPDRGAERGDVTLRQWLLAKGDRVPEGNTGTEHLPYLPANPN